MITTQNQNQIPTPPASRSGSVENETSRELNLEMKLKLDSFLEQYLDLLDRHQNLQACLGKRLSSVGSQEDECLKMNVC